MIPARSRLPAALLLALASAVAACGGASPTDSGTPPAVTPPASAGAAASSEPGGGPQASRWPGEAIRGTLAIGAADNEIGEAAADLNKAIEDEDIGLMREAAAGLAGLDILEDRLTQMESFELTRPAAQHYRALIPPIVTAATALRDAIDAGDGAAVQQANLDLVAALRAYVEFRPALTELVSQAIFQERNLTR